MTHFFNTPTRAQRAPSPRGCQEQEPTPAPQWQGANDSSPSHRALVLGALEVLYLSVDTPIDRHGLGVRLGAGPARLDAALAHLERKGLVNLPSLRLTLPGLAAAASLHAAVARKFLAA